eukprot:Awhi_evm1s14771
MACSTQSSYTAYERVGKLPVVSASIDTATAWYLHAKEHNEYIRYGLETIEPTLSVATELGSKVMTNPYVAPSLAKMNEYGISNLDYIEKNYPVIKEEPAMIYSKASTKISETVGNIKEATTRELAQNIAKDIISHIRQFELLDHSIKKLQENLPSYESLQEKALAVDNKMLISEHIQDALGKMKLMFEQMGLDQEKRQILIENIQTNFETAYAKIIEKMTPLVESEEVQSLLHKIQELLSQFAGKQQQALEEIEKLLSHFAGKQQQALEEIESLTVEVQEEEKRDNETKDTVAEEEDVAEEEEEDVAEEEEEDVAEEEEEDVAEEKTVEKEIEIENVKSNYPELEDSNSSDYSSSLEEEDTE